MDFESRLDYNTETQPPNKQTPQEEAEMAQRLRACIALSEDGLHFPTLMLGGSQLPPITSAPGEPVPFSGPLQAPALIWCACERAHTQIKNIKQNIKSAWLRCGESLIPALGWQRQADL